jgi:hypothetical protein
LTEDEKPPEEVVAIEAVSTGPSPVDPVASQAGPSGSLGRPTKLDATCDKFICDAMERGATFTAAAGLVGISRRTLSDWLRRGADEDEGIYHDFSLRVEAALAAYELKQIENVNAGAIGDWRAALKLLERRFPSRWGEKKTTTINGTGPGGSIIYTGLTVSVIQSKEVDKDGRVIDASVVASEVVPEALGIGTEETEEAEEDVL